MQFLTNIYNELITEGGLKAALGLLWSFFLTSTGYPETAIESLVCLLVADFILGFSRAWKECTLCGDKIRHGAYKFVAYWVAIALFVQVDKTLLNALPMEISLTNLIIAYLGINEALSCLVHLSAFGLPVPEHFVKRLTKYKEKLEQTNACGRPESEFFEQDAFADDKPFGRPEDEDEDEPRKE